MAVPQHDVNQSNISNRKQASGCCPRTQRSKIIVVSVIVFLIFGLILTAVILLVPFPTVGNIKNISKKIHRNSTLNASYYYNRNQSSTKNYPQKFDNPSSPKPNVNKPNEEFIHLISIMYNILVLIIIKDDSIINLDEQNENIETSFAAVPVVGENLHPLEAFTGYWILESQENTDEMLKAFGWYISNNK